MNKEELSYFKDKKILVTGHTGFKGSWLCRILGLTGARVVGYSLAPSVAQETLYSVAAGSMERRKREGYF